MGGGQTKKYQFFLDNYAEDFHGIFGQRSLTRSQLLELFKNFDLNEYSIGNINVTMLGKSAAVLTYEVDERIASGGQKFLNHNSITSAWVKRGGKWMDVLFQPLVLKSTPV